MPGGNQQGLPSAASAVVGPHGLITTAWYQFFIALWTAVLGQGASGVFNTGDLKGIAHNSVPSGWLLCWGQAVSRATYSDLYSTIGTTWGAGDGLTTFNLPDFRDRVPQGANPPGTPVGTYGGGSVNLTVGQLPAHSHTITDPGHVHGVTDPTHTHSIPTGTVGGAGAYNANVNPATTPATGASATGVSVNNAATLITINNTGAGDPVTFQPPFGAMNWIIKT